MPLEGLTRKLFAITSNIRYIAVYRGGDLTLQARSRLPNASSSETDRYEELLVNPTLITLARQRGNLDCGGLHYLLVRYGNFYQLIIPLDDGHISLAFEPQSKPLEYVAAVQQALEAEPA